MEEKIKNLKFELKNIRQNQKALKVVFKKDFEALRKSLGGGSVVEESVNKRDDITYTPIGYIETVYKHKNGIPRQGSLCEGVVSRLRLENLNNSQYALSGLEEFSHVWILFHFHHNNSKHLRTKIHPPRMDGASVGVFSTRSPHRPNPIGLTLATVVKVQDSTLYLAHTDLLHNTPVIDLKPYISLYDSPFFNNINNNITSNNNNDEGNDMDNNNNKMDANNEMNVNNNNATIKIKDNNNNNSVNNSNNNDNSDNNSNNNYSNDNEDGNSDAIMKRPKMADWVGVTSQCEVIFSNRSLEGVKKLKRFNKNNTNNKNKIESNNNNNDNNFESKEQPFLTSIESLKRAIISTLSNDPRSVYRKQRCSDKLYYFRVDKVVVTCWFDEEERDGDRKLIAEVLKIKDE